MTVLPYTGQRRGDAVRLGPHSVVGGKFDLDNLNDSSIEVRQNKTGKELEIPLAAQLAALKACKIATDAPAFILADSARCRPAFRDDLAHHSDLKSPTHSEMMSPTVPG
ncbi:MULTISPECIES: hypothetical protein [unclassified Bradyrhizobium]|uniref:hypothetical protein n=1 Tax=unclassified Bradyrhizobium TaxID=2631580 RepID=UPI001CD5B963|nr:MULTISPECIES: hypothetical protein [unclassified Bradyrhizobium]MCA1502167.1 hypothetical protein [Bradyrhizobium sp. NBAIM14]MCA1552494.1 hypothetical protein [Bradyrhizobium sp. BRP19]